jgi:hypothetical protein
MDVTTSSSAPAPSRRLPPRWRKALLTAHVAVSVGLLGTDATVVLLASAGLAGRDPVAVYPAADLVVGALLVPLALAAVVSGVALGVLTPWGLVRHWWVTVKLALTVAGAVLAVVVLRPTADALAEAARTGAGLGTAERVELLRDGGAASLVLLVTIVLSVYKPFGRLRDHRRAPASGRRPLASP